ncbi:MAG: ATP synthase F1 subunit delta [Candidatus Hinthialibacter antarcticus]|nr:ATP synthase F1 subunit delta [Candidatus Hinthialibacter antarcticus]
MERDPDVSKNYASALLAAAGKHNVSLDDALSEALSLRELILSQSRFKVFLEGPQFRADDKRKMIRDAFQNNSSELFMYFLLLLLRRGRLDHLIDILDEFERLVEKEGGVTEGLVTTAVELSDEEKDTLRQKLDAYCERKFIMQFKVDPTIVGGVRVQFGDTLIDATIQSQLVDLRRRMSLARLAS